MSATSFPYVASAARVVQAHGRLHRAQDEEGDQGTAIKETDFEFDAITSQKFLDA